MRRFNWTQALVVLCAVVAVVAVTPHALEHFAHLGPRGVTGLLLLPALAGTISDSVAQDKSAYFVTDTVRQQFNLLAEDWMYFFLNGVMSTTVATLPVVDIGGTATKVKTTNNTVLKLGGVATALNATDDLWTLTGGVLAVSSFRRYLLLHDGVTATVLASDDSTVSAASCRFPKLPPNGTAVVGVLTVATDATHTFTPAVTNLSAAGITDTYIDGIDISVPLAKLITA